MKFKTIGLVIALNSLLFASFSIFAACSASIDLVGNSLTNYRTEVVAPVPAGDFSFITESSNSGSVFFTDSTTTFVVDGGLLPAGFNAMIINRTNNLVSFSGVQSKDNKYNLIASPGASAVIICNELSECILSGELE